MVELVRPRIVIVGAGFGGLNAARTLAKHDVDVTVIDQQNHHLFQPLLYQVATATLSPADIAAPIRSILKAHRNVRVVLDKVTGVDTAQKNVLLTSSGSIGYDWLILATGARHSYFGKDDWAEVAPGLKTIDDATRIRRDVLLALENAEIAEKGPARDALLTFIVIGGGPTGVEMAGAIAELARATVSRDFRTITPHCSRIILADGDDRLLRSFPEKLSAKAKASLESMNVEVHLGKLITEVHDHGAVVGDQLVRAQTIVWAAGVMASPAAQWLGCEGDRTGRVFVGPDLRVAGHDMIFAIGDTAACADGKGGFLPGVAPVAKQQGKHAAKTILNAIRGKPTPAFAYRNYGNMATIGRKRAVADFGWLRISGFPAWLLWCTIHIMFLANFRNRLTVGLTWLWNYITFDRNARLITGIREGGTSLLVTKSMP
jgi:NADH dehydrogenase